MVNLFDIGTAKSLSLITPSLQSLQTVKISDLDKRYQ